MQFGFIVTVQSIPDQLAFITRVTTSYTRTPKENLWRKSEQVFIRLSIDNLLYSVKILNKTQNIDGNRVQSPMH